MPRGVLGGAVLVFFSLNVEFTTASDFSNRGDLIFPGACDSVAAGDFLPVILRPIRDHLVVTALLFVPTPDFPESIDVSVFLLPSTLPTEDLTRALGRTELNID
jgi:hypothetical protein